MYVIKSVLVVFSVLTVIASAEFDNNATEISDDNSVKIFENPGDRQCPENKTCIVKCCPLGESLGPHKLCQPTNLNFQVQFFGEHQDVSNYTHSEEEYHFIYGISCPYGK